MDLSLNPIRDPETHNFKGEPYPDWSHANLSGRLSDLYRAVNDGTKHPLSGVFREVVYKTKARRGEYEATPQFSTLLSELAGGIYVLWRPIDGGEKAEYVGISRDLLARLKQHLFGKTKNTSSFVYQALGRPSGFTTSIKRIAMQKDMRDHWKVSIVPLDTDSYMRQIAEVFLSAQLKTHWNSFETH